MEKPLKNYLIYIVLIIVTIVLTLYFSKSYIKSSGEKSILYGYINEIKPDDFEQFITETPDSIIYISSINNIDNIKFEKQLKKKIESLNIKDSVVFINVENMNSGFINILKEKYNIDLDVSKSGLLMINDLNISYMCINNDTSLDKIDFSEFK